MKKRMISLIMAVVMVLSLCTVAFATETTTTYAKPKTTRTVNSLTDISSVTVNGTAATYHRDSNTGFTTSSPAYIRATVSGTEYNLQTATVVITTTGSEPAVMLGNTTIAETSNTGNAYTYSLDLYNKAYTVSVGNESYTLAAGLTKTTSPISIPANDPMRIEAMSIGGATGSIQMSVVNNPYMGNPYYTMWTSVSYTVKAAMEGSTTRSALNASITLPNGASAPATDSCLTGTGVTGTGAAVACTLNLTDNTTLKVTYGNYSRNYTVIATDANTISVSFGIDFTEAKASEYYTGNVATAVDTLVAQATEFFGGNTAGATYGEITVAAGSTVMDVMHQFAEKYGYTSEVPDGCTYMATLNGIGEFDFGSNSGWMYTDEPNWDDAETNDEFYKSWNTPPIGGASYTLSEGDTICWFICCDYTHHPW